jgi:integrase
VPLIALFNGLRMNEACQLYAHDIGEEDGVPFIRVHEDVDGEAVADKHLKGSASWRTVPVHPELIKMGFLEFVSERKRQGKSARLFPELKIAEEVNRYSKVFSKWFGRFVKLACDGKKPKATFHSLRHHFRSAFATTDVRNEVVEALGGWRSKGSSEMEYRHYRLRDLRDALSKVKYPELDLAHLYVN